VIPKENNFKQAGERFRSWPRDEQERFIKRMAGSLNHPRLTAEHRRIWLSNWAACDAGLGAALGKLVNVKAAM
jgi:catalase